MDHLIDFCSPARAYSAGDFCSDVKDLLLQNPEKNFVLVGGTGLYLQALTLGLPRIPSIDCALRESLEKNLQNKGLAEMCALAQKVDPEAMLSVDENNPHRILRILEVWQGTGRKLSEWKKEREGGIGEIPVFWLTRSRENLYARINARVDQMVQQGWLEEVQKLSKTVPLDAPAWQSLGYRELLNARDATSVESVLDEVKKKTRNYAKRQNTWFYQSSFCWMTSGSLTCWWSTPSRLAV